MKGNENIDLSKLTKRQLTTLPHILAAPSYEEAAKRAEITPKQIYQWLKDPTFCAELKKQRNEVFFDALAFLKTGVQKASQTLLSLLSDEDPRIRLLASEKVLSNAFKSLELLEIEERIIGLEAIVAKMPKNSPFGTHP